MPRKTNGITAPTRKKKASASIAPTATPQFEEVRRTLQDTRLEDEIRRRAYEIYLSRNGSPGDESQDWLIAEREVRARHQQGHSA
jgi:DUF2934 family protein